MESGRVRKWVRALRGTAFALGSALGTALACSLLGGGIPALSDLARMAPADLLGFLLCYVVPGTALGGTAALLAVELPRRAIRRLAPAPPIPRLVLVSGGGTGEEAAPALAPEGEGREASPA